MADTSDDVTLEVQGLDQILKALKRRAPQARVGILGGGARSNGKTTNAQVGAAHEFGTSRLPQRSFLRIPISENLQEAMDSAGLMKEDVIREVIKTGNLMPWIQQVTKLAEGIVLEAFASNGYGKWASWANGYSSMTGQILVNSTQLRNSITSEVKE